jgi:hypothetical protein
METLYFYHGFNDSSRRFEKVVSRKELLIKEEIGMYVEFNSLGLDNVYLMLESIVVVAKAEGGLFSKRRKKNDFICPDI